MVMYEAFWDIFLHNFENHAQNLNLKFFVIFWNSKVSKVKNVIGRLLTLQKPEAANYAIVQLDTLI